MMKVGTPKIGDFQLVFLIYATSFGNGWEARLCQAVSEIASARAGARCDIDLFWRALIVVL